MDGIKKSKALRPDFISFYRSEWRKETQFIYCKDGRVFEQVHRDRYRAVYCVLVIIAFAMVFLFAILFSVKAPLIYKAAMLFLIGVLTIFPIVSYRISRFKLIEDVSGIKEPDEETIDI